MKKTGYTTQRGALSFLFGIATLALLQLPSILFAEPPGNPPPGKPLACKDKIQVSMNGDGCTVVSVGMVLENSQDQCLDHYAVEIRNELEWSIGNVVCCEDMGQTLTVHVTDTGSGSQCWGTITVEDLQPPTPLCVDELIVGTTGMETTFVFAWMLDNGSYDNCGQVLAYSFSPDIGDFSLAFTKNDPGYYPVQLWVTDGSGNRDFCVTIIEVKDNLLN